VEGYRRDGKYTINFGRKIGREESAGSSRCTLENYIKININETGWDVGNWIRIV
jgi:hypothetical protein